MKYLIVNQLDIIAKIKSKNNNKNFKIYSNIQMKKLRIFNSNKKIIRIMGKILI